MILNFPPSSFNNPTFPNLKNLHFALSASTPITLLRLTISYLIGPHTNVLHPTLPIPTIKFSTISSPLRTPQNRHPLLLNPQPHTPSLYLLPKVHKPDNPGCSIVSSYGSPIECISAYIDAHLQSFVTSLPSHVQDTNHFLDMIQSLPTPSHLTPSWPLLKSLPHTPTFPTLCPGTFPESMPPPAYG